VATVATILGVGISAVGLVEQNTRVVVVRCPPSLKCHQDACPGGSGECPQRQPHARRHLLPFRDERLKVSPLAPAMSGRRAAREYRFQAFSLWIVANALAKTRAVGAAGGRGSSGVARLAAVSVARVAKCESPEQAAAP
jgi:hypothetical protein